MKKNLQALTLLLCLFLSACYDVPYLIEDEKAGLIKDEALGSWVSIKKTPLARGMTLEIRREENSPWYLIRRVDLRTKEVRNLRAIVHQIGERQIMSYQDDRDKDFSIFEIRLNNDASPARLEAIALGEGAPRFSSKKQFLAFLKSERSKQWFKEGYLFERTD